MTRAEKPSLLMIFTGGTISCTLDPERRVPVPTLRGQEILRRAPAVADLADVELDDFGRHPGPHMTPARMLELAARIREATADGDHDGVVVTHGTDTLEETAFVLDRLLDGTPPVVVVGAMKLASDPCWDGAANLESAARVALDPASRGRGIQVVMADQIHGAVQVRKVHTESLEAFASPETGPVGAVDRGDVIYFAPPPARPAPLRLDDIGARVDLILAAAGADGNHVEASLDAGADGLVVAGLGRGNLPPALAASVEFACRRIPVVLASRCPRGRPAPLYGYEGGGARLRESGALFAGYLGAVKARLLLLLLLSSGADRKTIAAELEGSSYDRCRPGSGHPRGTPRD